MVLRRCGGRGLRKVWWTWSKEGVVDVILGRCGGRGLREVWWTWS